MTVAIEGVTMKETRGKRTKWRSFAAVLLCCLAVGAGFGFTIGKVFKYSLRAAHAGGGDIVALTLAAFFTGLAVLLVWTTSDRMRLARILEGEGADVPASDGEVRSFHFQALVLALAGILLALPVFGARLFQADLDHGRLYFAGIALLFAVQSFYNVRLWQISDEFVRKAIVAAAAATFAIGQGGLFLWAAAERMSLVKPIASWDLILVTMLLYLFVGSMVSMRTLRRG